ncbi:uncharacterized protein LOC131593304 [Vicia villosa]|uniref:uncharacterized protein LOC131593304 n=1 Tax=Vicia villosa TaxID=3911 RepID=UPI00273BD618|nr:uncharacterized protein LOC131593304 [Vicia villosa]
MEAIQRETLVSLSNSVKLLLEKIVSIYRFRITNGSASLLEKVKHTLVDLQDLLYYANNRLIPSQANNKSLDMLRRAVFQISSLLYQTDFLRRINLYPHRKSPHRNSEEDFVSISLRAVETTNMCEGWSRHVKYKFSVFNQLDSNMTITDTRDLQGLQL